MRYLHDSIVVQVSPENMQTKITQVITEWNRHAHPFNWSTKSVAKVMADAPMKKTA